MTALVDELLARHGVITPPAYVHVPAGWVRSRVDFVTGVAALVGRELDGEQRFAVDVLTGLRADGRPAALESAVIVSRQNLKTYIKECIAVTNLVEPDPEGRPYLAIWSAQLFDTAQESFRTIDELFASSPDLSRYVKKVHRGNGEEEIECHGNRRLKFKARSKTGGRGLSGDDIYLDEGFALLPGHMGALLPTLSTRRRARVYYGSSPGMPESEVLRGVRDRGRAGGPGAPAYVEWCAPGSLRDPGCSSSKCDHRPGTAGCTLDREDYLRRSNPAVDRGRISLDYLRSERLALPPEEYARERFGWWDDPAGESPITPDLWARRADPQSRPLPRPVALAVDTTAGLRSATVAAVGWRADKLAHGELLRLDQGTDWLVAFLREKQTATGGPVMLLGGSSTAQAIVPELDKARVRYVEVPPGDYASACVLFAAEVVEDRWRHLGDPLTAAAVAGAGTRDVGDAGAWRWSPKESSSDITPLTTLTLARWGLATVAKAASTVY